MLVLLVRHLSKTFDVGFTCTSFKQDLKLPTSSFWSSGELHKGAYSGLWRLKSSRPVKCDKVKFTNVHQNAKRIIATKSPSVMV